MSKDELESQYEDGKLSRRGFIRSLTGLGLSITAANRLADTAEAKGKGKDKGKGKGKDKDKKDKKKKKNKGRGKDDTYNRW